MAKRQTVPPVEEVKVEETIVPVDESTETIEEAQVDEAVKLTSTDEVMNAAAENPEVDKTIVDVPVEEDTAPASDFPAQIEVSSMSDIVKNDSLSLMDKINKITELMPQVSAKVAKSIVALYTLCSSASTRTPEKLNREQKYFVRAFFKLAAEPDTVFAENMRFISWIYRQLSDVKVLAANDLPTYRNESPLEPSTCTLYIAGKNDGELNTFFYLVTILDVKINSKTVEERTRPIAMDKATTNNNLTEDICNKINLVFKDAL